MMPIRAKHRRPVVLYDDDQGLNSVQPAGFDTLGAGEAHQKFRLIPERPKRTAAGDRNRVVEAGGPGHWLMLIIVGSDPALRLAPRLPQTLANKLRPDINDCEARRIAGMQTSQHHDRFGFW